jgi:DNA modification methylase
VRRGEEEVELNKVYNMDCIEYMKTLPDESVDLIIADPPANKIVKDKWDNQWENEDDYVEWALNVIIECERILKKTGTLYLYQWIGEKNPLTMSKIMLMINQKTNLKFKNIITWRKDRGFGVQKNYMYVREEILFYTKDKKEYTFNIQYGNIKRNYIRKCGKSYFKRVGNVWIEIENDEFPCQNIFDDINENTYEKIKTQREIEYSLDTKAKSLHSTQKPLQLAERLIKASSNKNDIIYIPFAGSGSEIESCIINNRNWIATELNKDYIDEIIMPRISKYEYK